MLTTATCVLGTAAASYHIANTLGTMYQEVDAQMSPITLSQKYEKLYGANVFGKSEGTAVEFESAL